MREQLADFRDSVMTAHANQIVGQLDGVVPANAGTDTPRPIG
jgi:hypothetical protein